MKKLMELAEKNTPKLFPAELKSMEQVLKGIAGTYLRNDYKEESFDNLSAESVEIPLYVLSNQRNLHGAAVILYDGILREFAGNMGSDLIILPSSIHEVLLIPYEEGSDLSELKQMVMYVNSTEVSEEEILSVCIITIETQTLYRLLVRNSLIRHRKKNDLSIKLWKKEIPRSTIPV